jgi:XTP/dITP diphosphohydrolase
VSETVFHLATGNAGKAREFTRLLRATVLPIEDYVPAPEHGASFEENARTKAIAARPLVADGWVLADDSGLEVDALGGAPGVLSARYGGPDLDDAERCAVLLDALVDEPVRSARFRCVLVAIDPSGREVAAEGRLEGSIAAAPSGAGGFGYDPVFVPIGQERTCAALHPEEKDAISHRGAAARRLLELLGPCAPA